MGPQIGNGAFLIMVHNKCHIIGGSKSNKHYTYNNETSQFEEIFEFKSFERGCTGFKVIYVSSQNRLYLFGGYDYGRGLNGIWSHTLGTNEWIKLKQTMPVRMNGFGFIKSLDEQYAFMFAGYANGYFEEIYVVNLNTFKFIQSKTACPDKNKLYHVINGNGGNYAENELLINGFIRLQLIDLPKYIIDMIVRWYSLEFAYALSTKGSLWKINLNDLIAETLHDV